PPVRPDHFGFASKKPSRPLHLNSQPDPAGFPCERKTTREKSRARAGEGRRSGESRALSGMLELLLVGCSSVVVLLHGASLFLRALFAPRHAVARPISFLGFVA
ncbi:unnamed protein product, partial [Urochloa humidicola]